MIFLGSLGIIGGADGPTAVFVTTSFSWDLLALIGVLIAGVVFLFKHRKK